MGKLEANYETQIPQFAKTSTQSPFALFSKTRQPPLPQVNPHHVVAYTSAIVCVRLKKTSLNV
jgi:hypothetical protein